MSQVSFNYNLSIVIPKNDIKLTDSEREALRDVKTDKIVDMLQDPNISAEYRKQLVDELQDRLKNDPDMDPELKKDLADLLLKADKGPVSDDEATRLKYGIDRYNDGELKELGLSTSSFETLAQLTPEGLKSDPSSKLVDMTLWDMSNEDRKELAAELRERASGLSGQDKVDADKLIDKIERGGKLSFEEMDKLSGLLPDHKDGIPDEDVGDQ